jgi:asparagine synthetase B (glutamine-hydrolysing)
MPMANEDQSVWITYNAEAYNFRKLRDRRTTKYIVRQAMRDVLPSEVLEQPKAGFAAPVDYWRADDLRDLVDERLSGRQDWPMQIWQSLTLAIWMRLFLDGGARSFVSETLETPAGAATV